MATHKTTWKNFEKHIASRLGLKRVSIEKKGLEAEDVRGVLKLKDSVRVVGECKLRGKIPVIIEKMLEQAKRASGKSRRYIPIAFFKGKGGEYDNVFVCMRLSDFERLLDKKKDKGDG